MGTDMQRSSALTHIGELDYLKFLSITLQPLLERYKAYIVERGSARSSGDTAPTPKTHT